MNKNKNKNKNKQTVKKTSVSLPYEVYDRVKHKADQLGISFSSCLVLLAKGVIEY